MAVIKRVLCPQRLRRVPEQFSWIDHRLVRDRHIVGRSAGALSLYLFLVTVADGSGLSYYSDQGICQLLPLDAAALAAARRELLAAGGEVMIFPEGTSSLGPHHLPFKSGAASIAAPKAAWRNW